MTTVDLIAQTLEEHRAYPNHSPHCTCGWRPAMYLNDDESDRRQLRAHQAQAVTEALGLAQILADQDMLRRIIRALPGPLEMARLRQERP